MIDQCTGFIHTNAFNLQQHLFCTGDLHPLFSCHTIMQVVLCSYYFHAFVSALMPYRLYHVIAMLVNTIVPKADIPYLLFRDCRVGAGLSVYCIVTDVNPPNSIRCIQHAQFITNARRTLPVVNFCGCTIHFEYNVAAFAPHQDRVGRHARSLFFPQDQVYFAQHTAYQPAFVRYRNLYFKRPA